MKKTEILFFGTVIFGAIGAGLLLSPADRLYSFWIIAFAAEMIRAGLVLVNVQIMKINRAQYWVVLTAAVIATIGIGMAIDSRVDRWSAEWYGGQVINFLVLAGEYSWALLIAGPPIDWEMECLQARGDLSRCRTTIEQIRGEKEVQMKQVEDLTVSLDALQTKLDQYSTSLDDREKELAKTLPVFNSVQRLAGKKISVNRAAAQVCPNCSSIVAAPSNSHKPENCQECGTELIWK